MIFRLLRCCLQTVQFKSLKKGHQKRELWPEKRSRSWIFCNKGNKLRLENSFDFNNYILDLSNYPPYSLHPSADHWIIFHELRKRFIMPWAWYIIPSLTRVSLRPCNEYTWVITPQISFSFNCYELILALCSGEGRLSFGGYFAGEACPGRAYFCWISSNING